MGPDRHEDCQDSLNRNEGALVCWTQGVGAGEGRRDEHTRWSEEQILHQAGCQRGTDGIRVGTWGPVLHAISQGPQQSPRLLHPTRRWATPDGPDPHQRSLRLRTT